MSLHTVLLCGCRCIILSCMLPLHCPIVYVHTFGCNTSHRITQTWKTFCFSRQWRIDKVECENLHDSDIYEWSLREDVSGQMLIRLSR